ncbi:DUF4097 family beta strand repeat-containing protein [Gracilimonas tropica]|uniref:DUF4097 family beta strand repeat-containing protein n=1 Tax=Gracilimonas tropica TaxID=454600 RepID=UPI00035D11E2|nr:hypothetical protein [Gracilimonas tropica]
MKISKINTLKIGLAGLFAVIASTQVLAQKPVYTQRMNEEVEMVIPASEFNAGTIFHMENINGDLNVEGYDGDEIIITGNKIVKGAVGSSDDFHPEEIYLDRLSGTNSIFVFIRHPHAEVEIEGDELNYNFNSKNRDRKGRWYDENQMEFEFNLQIKIPHRLEAEISTINGGEVVVSGMSNRLQASNINGSVIVVDNAGPVNANTVNGNIKVELTTVPSEDLDFNTVNGNIELIAPENLNVVVTFKSLHGELYTNFDQVKHVRDRVHKSKDGMSRFSIGSRSRVQFGEGGPEIRFQLLNGDGYIKKKTS